MSPRVKGQATPSVGEWRALTGLIMIRDYFVKKNMIHVRDHNQIGL